ncbi:hypothetical protein GPECTOR_21g651 [Gonium pectorale]|uniref:Uncharacterized protein n=1 Tax=Gonium pectorale TaxID=33097 RepID=A0A150GIC6_GONPE|nr:hypothetical protein GPECTOR_21g651 [Gonium pectorale]|eukprot:KXZ49425.1 hypothetical protein GPECTOR_21g651 [Gonium pectorale]
MVEPENGPTAAGVKLVQQAGDPALARETLLDKVLYPWSKDASTDDSNARAMAKSYHDYLREKEQQGKPYDPLGAMAHDREYDTAKLPATVQQVERSAVDMGSGQRSGNNQAFLAERAPHAGQAPLPEGAKAAVRSLADDTAAHGRAVVAGLAGLRERVEEEEARGGARGALTTRGPQRDDPESYRDPHSDKAWHAAEVTQANIDTPGGRGVAACGPDRPTGQPAAAGEEGAADVARGSAAEEAVGGAAGYARGAAETVAAEARRAAGATRGAAEVAGEEAARKASGAAGYVRGAAEVAGEEAQRAGGAAAGAAQVAAEETSRTAGGLLGALRKVVGGGDGGGDHQGRHQEQQPHQQPQPHAPADQPPVTRYGYGDAPRAVADIYEEQRRKGEKGEEGGQGDLEEERRQQQGPDVAERAGEEAAGLREDVAARTEGAERVVGSAAREAAEGVQAAAERGGERAVRAADEARETGGGLVEALKGLLLGTPEERRQRERHVEERRQHETQAVQQADREAAEREQERQRERESGGAAGEVGLGDLAEDISRGLGKVAGGVMGALEKLQEVGGAGGKEGRERGAGAPAGAEEVAPPMEPYTSTAEIMAARREQEGQ